uniref:Methyltransferase type 11 domain-containing protein n=1 Tax=Lepeophtheirus salmonis TaxID=72036 RepID=A0A0K2UCF4_LEPSM
MICLPTNNSDYSSPNYWESRYCQEKDEDYEWLGNYEAFRGVLTPGLNPLENAILILGCGNSTLGPDMVEFDGFRDVTSIDIAGSVIQRQSEKYKDNTYLKWKVMDISNLSSFDDESLDVVIEKATVDALIASEKSPWCLSNET